MDILDRIKAALASDTPSRVEWRTQLESALFEIERLQEAKRAALKVADERSKENAALRAEIGRLRQPITFTTDNFPGPPLRCTVCGPEHVVVEVILPKDGI